MIIHCNVAPKNRTNLLAGELVLHQIRDQSVLSIVLQNIEDERKMVRLDPVEVGGGHRANPAFKVSNLPDGFAVSFGTDWVITVDRPGPRFAIDDQAPRTEGCLSRSTGATYLAVIGGGQFDDHFGFLNLGTWAVERDAQPLLALGHWSIWANDADALGQGAHPIWQSPR